MIGGTSSLFGRAKLGFFGGKMNGVLNRNSQIRVGWSWDNATKTHMFHLELAECMVLNTGIHFLLINHKSMMNNFVNLIEFYCKKFNPYLTTYKKDREVSYEFLGDKINRLNVTIIVCKNWVNIYLGKRQIQVIEDLNLLDEKKHLEICKYLNLLFDSCIEEIEFFRRDEVKCIEYHF